MDMSVSEATLMVMRESGLQCGFRDAMPASPSVARQVEADVIALLSRDDYMVGSDGIPFDEGVPHPAHTAPSQRSSAACAAAPGYRSNTSSEG